MTDVVNPSFKRLADSYLMSGTIEGKSPIPDYVVPAAESPTVLADDQNLSGFNEFDENSSSGSLNVTIDGGEAFVFGTWLARDTQTGVPLAANTAGQTVYVGWVDGSPNEVKIGRSSAFSSYDRKTAVWTFDTDGSGVTNVTDERTLGTEVDFFGDDNADITFDGTNITVTSADGTDAFIFRNTDTESIEPFIAPDVTTDVVTLNNQASNATDAVRYDQFTSLSSDVNSKADNPHDNSQHSEDYQTATDVTNSIDDHQANDVHVTNQPPQVHDHSASGEGGSALNLVNGSINLPVRSSDPSSPDNGEFWVRDDI